ncbi:VacJ family lipoprotein [Rhodosalinus sp.]|uniref:MlaA family lipoprotein n=1 Tax=Rhodosalinus sp. TaxID=2047741 RepID=UPI00397D6338
MRVFRPIVCLVGLVVLSLTAGCARAPGGEGQGVHDPYEAANRRVHAFNVGFDRAVTRPVARGMSAEGEPSDLALALVNFADNLGAPQMAVNRLLQGELGLASRNVYRFVVNSTLGFGGLFDVAADFGVPADDTDFGQTLHVWGVPEGAYQELPILGPSTERRTAGRIVDVFTNPLGTALTPAERRGVLAVRLAGRVAKRGRFGGAVDSVLHESADSYAQSRLIYLQNRRFELSGGEVSPSGADFTDPYEELYAE